MQDRRDPIRLISREAIARVTEGSAAGVALWSMLFVLGVLPARLADDPGVLLLLVFGILTAGRLRRLMSALLLVASFVVGLIALSPISDHLYSRWVRQDALPTGGVTAIIVPSSGLNPDSTVSGDALDRLLYGLELIRDGKAPVLVTTITKELFPTGAVSSEVDQSRIVSLFASRIVWIQTPGGRSTRDEAVESAKVLLPRSIRRIAVVTSPMHTRRACATFEAVGFGVTCIPARTRDLSSRPVAPLSSARLRIFGALVYEISAMAEYRVRGWVAGDAAVALQLTGQTRASGVLMTRQTPAQSARALFRRARAAACSRDVISGITSGLAVLAALSCGAPSNVRMIESALVSLASSTLHVGQSTTATAMVKSSSGAPINDFAVVWKSSNAAVATVSSAGVVTAVNLGNADIIASVGGVTAQATLAVVPAPVSVASRLGVTRQPSSSAQSGQALAQQPAIQLLDSARSPVAQSGIVVTAAIATGSGTLGGTTTATTDGNGIATFTSLSLTGTVGNYTLSFSGPGLATTNSTTISLAAGAPSQLLVSPIGVQTVATAFNVTVSLVDASGNPAPNIGAAGVIGLSVKTGAGMLGGSLTASLPVGASVVTLTGVTYSTAEQGVQLQATGTGTASAVAGKSGISNAFTVTSTGGASPNIYPTDGTMGWTFNGTSSSSQAGAFVTGDGQTPFLAATDPMYVGWLSAQGEGPNGINAVKRTYPISTSNVGPAFFYLLPAPQKVLYVRFFYKQSNPFNYDGTTNNHDYLKLIRLEAPSGQQLLTPGAQPGGQFISGFEAWDAYYNNGVIPVGNWSFNTHLGTWNCFEVMFDLTVANQAHQIVWVNDNKVLDATDSGSGVASATTSMGMVQFDGTINSMASSSTAWFTMIGVSTQRMGCPAGYTFPP